MVSIIIPTFRRPDFLRRALSSVARQTVRDFEVVVVDDGSPEESDYQKVAREFEKIFKEFFYIRNANNLGANASRNIGIRNSHYDLLAFLDDDDEWMPTKIERQLSAFRNADNSIGIVYTWADAAYGKINPGDLLTTSPTPGHAMRVGDPAKAQGSIIGKAMEGLDHGRGRILVLVDLQ